MREHEVEHGALLAQVPVRSTDGWGDLRAPRRELRPFRRRLDPAVSLATFPAGAESLTKMTKDAVDALDHAHLLFAEILESVRAVRVGHRNALRCARIYGLGRQASERRAAHDRRRASGRS